MATKRNKVIPLKPADRRKRGEARDLILGVALEQFSTLGFDGMTTRGLAEACGVNHSLITYHFGDKDNLWKRVMEALFGPFIDRLNARTEGLGNLEPEIAMKITIRDFAAFCAERPELHRIMTLEGRHRTERLEWLVDKYMQGMFDKAVTMIKQGQKQGTIKPGNPARLYQSIVSIVGSSFAYVPQYEMLTGEKADPSVIIEEIMVLVERIAFVPNYEQKPR